jgi:hypothetical protein
VKGDRLRFRAAMQVVKAFTGARSRVFDLNREPTRPKVACLRLRRITGLGLEWFLDLIFCLLSRLWERDNRERETLPH